MSWQTDNAVKRIFNTFKRLKTNIFNQDIEALKLLNEELIEAEKRRVNDNLLYAKLLCFVLDKNLIHHGSIKIAIKATNDILLNPIDYYLQSFHKNLNNQDMINYFNSIGIDMNDINDKNKDEIISKNQKEIIEKLSKNWTYENVEKSFYKTATEFLNDINNYV